MVIREARAVVRRVYELVFATARELYPDDWRRLRPGLLTLASWVGYDTDGRADIGWTTTFASACRSQVDQLRHYRRQSAPRGPAGAETGSAAAELIDARLSLAIKSGEDELEVLERRTAARPGRTAGRASRRHGGGRAIPAGRQRHSSTTWSTGHWRRPRTTGRPASCACLRAEVPTHGLALARTHVRINAHPAAQRHPQDDRHGARRPTIRAIG